MSWTPFLSPDQMRCTKSKRQIAVTKPAVQYSPAISNFQWTEQKVRDSAIIEIARLRNSKITPR